MTLDRDDYGEVLPENFDEDKLILSVGGDLHDDWRSKRELDLANSDGYAEPKTGEFTPRVKVEISHEDGSKWINQEDLKPEMEELQRQDIANTNFEDLDPKWQAENMDAAKFIVPYVSSAYEKGDISFNKGDDRYIEGFMENAAKAVHDAWKNRNDWVSHPDYGDVVLAGEYRDLPDNEKQKDRDHVDISTSGLELALAKLKESLNEFNSYNSEDFPKQRVEEPSPNRNISTNKKGVSKSVESPYNRFSVPLEKASWDVEFKGYNPNKVDDAARIPDTDKAVYMDPNNPKDIDFSKPDRQSYTGKLKFDKNGYPLNLAGRTGVEGKGSLGHFGPNHAADPIVVREGLNGENQILLIVRGGESGTDQYALPGGMVEKGDSVTATLKKELGEEAAVSLNFENSRVIYEGVVDDPRNTDNAWMETSGRMVTLTKQEGEKIIPKGGDDAQHAEWVNVSDYKKLKADGVIYASHSKMIDKALDEAPTPKGAVRYFNSQVGSIVNAKFKGLTLMKSENSNEIGENLRIDTYRDKNNRFKSHSYIDKK